MTDFGLAAVTRLAAFVVLGVGSLAGADVPKPEDIATCNSEAKQAVRKGSAAPSTPAPTASDERRAADVRRKRAVVHEDPSGRGSLAGDVKPVGTPQRDRFRVGSDAEVEHERRRPTATGRGGFRLCRRPAGARARERDRADDERRSADSGQRDNQIGPGAGAHTPTIAPRRSL